MLVRDVLTPNVISVSPKTTLPEAVRLMRERGIRHLPVVKDGKLVGIVSDRDLKRAMASPATSLEVHELRYLLDHVRVGEIMTRTVIRVGPMSPIEDAARTMFGKLDNPANQNLPDMNLREWATLVPLIIMAFWIGLYPAPFFKALEKPVNNLVKIVEAASPPSAPQDAREVQR